MPWSDILQANMLDLPPVNYYFIIPLVGNPKNFSLLNSFLLVLSKFD